MKTRASLPDHIRRPVLVLFVGINPGLRSAALGHHFAGYSNRFWKLLYDSRLVPVPLTYADDIRLPGWGFGLTNIVSRASGGSDSLASREYAAGRGRLLAKIRRFRPPVVALLGVSLYPVLCPDPRRGSGKKRTRKMRTRLGLQRGNLGGARVFVLPNPSGRNAHYSYREMLKAFRLLKRSLRDLAPPHAAPHSSSSRCARPHENL